MTSSQQRNALRRQIWQIANDVRATLLVEYNIGIRRISYGLFELEELPND